MMVVKSDDESSGNEYDADPDGDEDDSAYFSDLEELEDTAERGILQGNAKIRLKAANHDSSGSSSGGSSREGSTGAPSIATSASQSKPLSERYPSAPIIMTTEVTTTVAEPEPVKTTTEATETTTTTTPTTAAAVTAVEQTTTTEVSTATNSTPPPPFVATQSVLSLSEPRPPKSSIESIVGTSPDFESKVVPSKSEPKSPPLDISATPEESPQPPRLDGPAPRKGSDAGFLQLPVDLERQIQRASLIIGTFAFVTIFFTSANRDLLSFFYCLSEVDGAVKQPALGSKQRSVKQIERPKSEPGPEVSDKPEKPTTPQSSPIKTPKTPLSASSPGHQEGGGLNRSKHLERKRAARNAKTNVQLGKTTLEKAEQQPQQSLSPMNITPRKSNSGDANTKKFYDMVTEGAVQTKTKISKMGSVTTIDNIVRLYLFFFFSSLNSSFVEQFLLTIISRYSN